MVQEKRMDAFGISWNYTPQNEETLPSTLRSKEALGKWVMAQPHLCGYDLALPRNRDSSSHAPKHHQNLEIATKHFGCPSPNVAEHCPFRDNDSLLGLALRITVFQRRCKHVSFLRVFVCVCVCV